MDLKLKKPIQERIWDLQKIIKPDKSKTPKGRLRQERVYHLRGLKLKESGPGKSWGYPKGV